MIQKLWVDERVAVWKKFNIEIEADSIQEAVNKYLKEGDSCCLEDSYSESEYLYETEESPNIHSDINLEIMDESYNTLATR